MARPGFPVPKDIVPSGCGIKDWVVVTFYGETMAEVAKKKADYFVDYAPQGYSTHSLGGITKHPDGYYYLKIKRWSTCS